MYLGTSAIHSFRLASLDFEVKLQLSNVAYTQLHGSNGISWALLNAIQVCQDAVYSHLRNYVLTYPPPFDFLHSFSICYSQPKRFPFRYNEPQQNVVNDVKL